MASESCWGIAVDPAYSTPEGFTRVVIRGNHIAGVGNVGIGLAACEDCTIENNIVRTSRAFPVRGIAVPHRASGSGDLGLERVRVRNNSVYIAGRAGGSVGIEVGGEGEGHQVVSNAVYYRGRGGQWTCFRSGLGAAMFVAFDNNLCAFPRAQRSGAWIEDATVGRLVRAAWEQLSGFDGSSWEVAPSGRGGRAKLGALSPNTATAPVVDSGHASLSAKAAYGGWLRDARPDIGAHEWGANPSAALTSASVVAVRTRARRAANAGSGTPVTSWKSQWRRRCDRQPWSGGCRAALHATRFPRARAPWCRRRCGVARGCCLGHARGARKRRPSALDPRLGQG